MSGTSPHLQGVLESYFEAIEQGEEPDLDDLCRHDAELREEVEAMLANDPVALGLASPVDGPPPVVPAANLPAGRLGEFRLIAPIGAGGMGQVYLAQQDGLGRPVALKVLRPEALADPRGRLRLEREASIAGRIDHPSIVPIYAVGEDAGLPYIAMKWLSGPGLDALVEPLPPREAADVGAQVARALEEAHLSGVLHRDVKPANIILDNGRPVVVDFGLALSHQLSQRLSHSGQTAGTLPYMAPEQFKATSLKLDARTDVYALGATLYEITRGRPPFDFADTEPLIRDILFRDPPPLGLPPEHADFEAIVLRALEKEPDRRFDTAGDMADELERYLKGEPTRTRPLTLWDRAWRLARRHRGVVAAVAASAGVALLVLVAGAALYFRSESDFRARLDGLRAEVDDGHLGPVRRELAAMLPSRASHSGVRRLQRRLAAREALEPLFDLVMSRPEFLSPQALSEAVSRLDATASSLFYPRLDALARAVFDLHRDRKEEARRRLLELEAREGKSRATQALLAVVDGRDVPLELEARDALGHLLTFVALRRSSAPVGLQRDELYAARRRGGQDFRWGFAYAIHLTDAMRHAEAMTALEMLPKLDRPDDVVRRLMIRLKKIAGRLDEAEQDVRSIPVEDRTPWDVVNLMEILYRRGRNDEVRRELAAARSRWPGDEDISHFDAAWLLATGHDEEAIAIFERLARESVWPARREHAESYVLFRRVKHDEDAAAVGAAAAELAGRARSPVVRARALAVVGELAWKRGEIDRAWEAFSEARSTAGIETTGRLGLARIAKDEILDHRQDSAGGTPLPARLGSRLEEARAALDELFDPACRAVLPLHPRQEVEGRCYQVFLARLALDRAAMLRYLPLAYAAGDAIGWPEDTEAWEDQLDRYAELVGFH